MDYDSILLDVADGVATLTLNRPARLNSLTSEMHREIRHALDQVEASGKARVLVLTGAGRAFSAGQDLTESRQAGESDGFDAGRALEEHYNPLLLRLKALPMPVVAAVNGVAAGAAANLALACDIVIAARSATFLQAFARIGLLPDGGSTWFLPRLVGEQRARALAMLAPQITAQQARDWGLIWDVVEDADLMKTAGDLARRLADGPTMSLARIKEAMNRASGNTLSQQLDVERDFQRELGKSEDFKEGVAAFLAKRKPAFKGK